MRGANLPVVIENCTDGAQSECAAQVLAAPLSEPPNAFLTFLGVRTQTPRGGWPDVAIVFALFPLLLAWYFLPVLAPGLVLSSVFGDVAVEWWWKRGYLAEVFHGNQSMFLNPFIMGGTPFLASNQTALFYPPNWLFAFASRAWVLNFQTVFHFWLGLAAMYWLARRLGLTRAASSLAALVFGFSGFAILHWYAGHLVFVVEWPWTPLAMIAWMSMQTRSALPGSWRGILPAVLGLSGVLALQFLAGHPQIVYFTLLILFAFHAGWGGFALRHAQPKALLRGSLALGAALVLAALLTGVQWFPTLRFSELSVRSAATPMGYFFRDSHAPCDMLTTVAPWLLGGRDNTMEFLGASSSYWEVGAFLSVSAFMLIFVNLAALGSLSGFLWTAFFVLLGGWWLALGYYGGLYDLAFRVIPGFSFFRNPGRFLYLVTFAAALLSASGLDLLSRTAAQSPRKLLRVLIVLLGVLLVSGAVFMVLSQHGLAGRVVVERMRLAAPPAPPVTSDRVVRAIEQFSGCLAKAWLWELLVIGVCATAWFARVRRVTPIALCLLACFELAQFARPYQFAFRPEWHQWPLSFQRRVAAAGPQYRVGTARSLADLCQGMDYGVRHVWGYDAAVAQRYSKALGLSQGYAGIVPQWLYIMKRTPLIDALGTRFVIGLKGHALEARDWKLVEQFGDWTLYENPGALGRVQIVGQARSLNSQEIALAVNSQDFEPSSTVLLEEPVPASFSQTQGSPGKLEQVVLDRPEKFEARVSMQHGGWLVLMDQWLPGWSAAVDGKPARLYCANAVGRALYLPQGSHLVSMDYRTPGFALGVWFSLIGAGFWAACFGVWLLQHRKPKVQGS